MIQRYFLGANSKDGFVSLYGDFPPDGSFLHIIKGGPGTGKSGFMRRLGQAAEARGLDVHYVLCSGDPDSLDGVYIPTLRTAWADGTAPHAAEPAIFGVNSDYVNLGSFCRLPISPVDAEQITSLSLRYKALYRQAYSFLAAAAALEQTEQRPAPADSAAAELDALLDTLPAAGTQSPRRESRRFLHALSCKGDLRLSEEIRKAYRRILRVDDLLLQRAAQRCGGNVVLCLSPLRPDTLEAVLLPDDSLAFVGSGWQLPTADTLTAANPCMPADTETAALKARVLALALETLRQAKALHDEMEAIYGHYMDFAALTAYTDQVIAQLFL